MCIKQCLVYFTCSPPSGRVETHLPELEFGVYRGQCLGLGRRLKWRKLGLALGLGRDGLALRGGILLTVG